MNIKFRGPTFYCQEDEAVFFNWFKSLPEYKNITGEVRDLNLSLSEPISENSSIQLLTVFKRWRINTEPLSVLKTNENRNHCLWQDRQDNESGHKF